MTPLSDPARDAEVAELMRMMRELVLDHNIFLVSEDITEILIIF